MSEIEAVGDALTGGILSRAMEPVAGESSINGPSVTTDCLNCGAEISGDFCSDCGQKRRIHRTISAIGHELVHAVMHLDGKLWRTLPLLIWNPGELTRRYVHGERARFVSPLAMFLFSVFLMFAVLQANGASLSDVEVASPQQVRDSMDQLRADLVSQLAELREDRLEAGRNQAGPHRKVAQKTASIDERIAERQQEIADLDDLRSQAARLRFGDEAPTMRIGLSGLGGADYVLEEFDRNPGLAFYKLQSNSYKFSWLLIPISVPFMWLLFFRTRAFRAYDHTVFVTYSMSFMSLLAALLTIMGFVGVHLAIIAVAGSLIPPIHIFRQLKHAYGVGWIGALGRTLVLVGFCFAIATLYFVMLLTMVG